MNGPMEGLRRLELKRGPLRFTAYESEEAPADAPVVLCLHGFPDAPWSFRHQLAALSAAGFRAVAPTLRGYEPKSQPADGDYSIPSIAEDVVAWIDDLGVERAHLVGHDWGAITAYTVGAQAPERLLSLSTIAVPPIARFLRAALRVPRQIRRSWYVHFLQLSGVADRALERDDWALIRRLWRDWSPSYRLEAEEWAALRALFAAPGVKSAMLAYYRQNVPPSVMLGLRRPAFMRPRPIPAPLLAITGDEDGCLDTRLYEHAFLAGDYPAGHRVERIAGAGHFVQLEKPAAVNRLLVDWIRSHASPSARTA